MIPHRIVIVLLPLVLLLLLLSSRASAAEQPQANEEEDNKRFTRWFFEQSLGVRSLNTKGITLKNPMAGQPGPNDTKIKSSMVVQGDEVSPAVLGTLSLGGGVMFGPMVFGVELGVGVGGNARGPTRAAGDIDVRPSGFAALMNTSAFTGVMIERKHVRYRLDAVLGWELVGLGMERPGFPDTSVSAVNNDRWTLGPRFRVDFFVSRPASLGVAFGCDARNPTNASLSIVMSLL